MKQKDSKIDDTENRLRRNNLRLIGIPEKEEENESFGFVARLYEEYLETKFLQNLIQLKEHQATGQGYKTGYGNWI